MDSGRGEAWPRGTDGNKEARGVIASRLARLVAGTTREVVSDVAGCGDWHLHCHNAEP